MLQTCQDDVRLEQGSRGSIGGIGAPHYFYRVDGHLTERSRLLQSVAEVELRLAPFWSNIA